MEDRILERYKEYEDPPTTEDEDGPRFGLWSFADFNKYFAENLPQATIEQKSLLREVQMAINQRIAERSNKANFTQANDRLFYLTGDGGVGKTYFYNVKLSLFFVRLSI